MEITMTTDDKLRLAERIADHLCDTVDQKTLLQLYYDEQINWLLSMDDEELIETAETYL
jgi:hypothetical protein